jgi:hypothetical protein
LDVTPKQPTIRIRLATCCLYKDRGVLTSKVHTTSDVLTEKESEEPRPQAGFLLTVAIDISDHREVEYREQALSEESSNLPRIHNGFCLKLRPMEDSIFAESTR